MLSTLPTYVDTVTHIGMFHSMIGYTGVLLRDSLKW